MKKLLLAGSLAATTALAVCGATSDAGAQGQTTLVIQGGTLIDGNGGPPLANAVIVIQGNRITAVGAAGAVQVPAGAQVINAAGKWITPGLIDAKANWNWMYGEAFLHWGVTSAMVTGARNDQGIAERDAVNHGIFPGLGSIRASSICRAADRTASGRTTTSPAPAIASFARPRKRARWFATTSNRAPTSSAPMTATGRRKSSRPSPTRRTRPARAW